MQIQTYLLIYLMYKELMCFLFLFLNVCLIFIGKVIKKVLWFAIIPI